jgi:hypothetical protein
MPYSELGTQTGPTNPEHTTSNAQEVAVTIFYQPIFRKDQHIDLARPAISKILFCALLENSFHDF